MDARAELEAQIDRAPDDPAAYRVLADLLQARGDPQGELIARQLDGPELPLRHRDQPELWQFVVEHRAALFGAHQNEWYGGSADRFEWRWGFLRRVVTSKLEGLFALPVSRLVDTLHVYNFTMKQLPELRAAKHLRRLSLQAPKGEEHRTTIDLQAVSEVLPDLKMLCVQANVTRPTCPGLRSLELLGQWYSVRLAEVLETAQLPHLEVLRLELYPEWSLQALSGILARKLPALKHLGFHELNDRDFYFPALHAAGVLARLDVLELAPGAWLEQRAAMQLRETHGLRFQIVHRGGEPPWEGGTLDLWAVCRTPARP